MKHKLPVSYKKMDQFERMLYWAAYWKGYDHALDKFESVIDDLKGIVRKRKRG